MIDLKEKENKIPESQDVVSQKKIKDTAKEANSKKFLCVMIAMIVVFVSMVCVFVNNRNKKLEAELKILEAEKNKTTSIQSPLNSENAENLKENQGTSDTSQTDETASDTTSQPAVTAGITAVQPGTLIEPKIIEVDSENWHLTLVNSGYRIADSYEPDLVYVCESGEKLDRKVAEHYEKMYNAALKDGVTLTPCSGYRSYETQERNYNRKVEYFESQGYATEEAKVKAATIIMPPGSSEHNLGYAMDIVCVEEWFEDTEEFKWLQKNAADYGFIMRYPKEKQDITKVIYEPWHWRYVGVEDAKKLNDSGLVLEEYLGG